MPRVKFQIANWSSAFLWAFVLLAFGDIAGQSFNWVRAWWGS
jgi:membrane protein DedA with SNARE-associated domain